MYKNLCAEALAVSGRQSELIELALTYGFKGLDVDIAALARRAASQGVDHACRFLNSARSRSGGFEIGGFPLPVRWQGSEIDFKADLACLPQIAEVASAVGAQRCYTHVAPASDELPYHENFELHRQRIAETADVLARHGIRLALGFLAAASHRDGRPYQFIYQADPLLTLIKTIGSSNVGLLLDLWDWLLGGGGLDQVRQLGADQLLIVRVADVPAGADLGAIGEDERWLPGESETSQVAALLALLAELDYDGPVTPFPHPGRFSGMTRDAIVQRVGAVLDEQLKAAGLSKSGKPIAGAES